MPDSAKTTKAKTADLAARFGALAAVPAPADDHEPEATTTRPPRTRQPRAAAPMPAEQPAPKDTEWVRVPLNVEPEMRLALEQARLVDRIETTVRIRAMIQLWQEDERLRARIDKRAKALREELVRSRRPGR